ncbi:MAG: CDP-alcohol phosphatidyltransferase family protein [Deltaproteobacteria bacterium]|jgi:CDP-diacylglycerol--glycerol-3-phosphate 3-phosphatidyltransferase|nr:CDP-alcohol phosphatidyltransferase family protein [Deltaproteobacteria bacterium]
MASTIRKDLRTAPNIVTLLRIGILCLAVPVYFYVSHGAGIVLAIVAGVTDYLDGYLARRLGQVTRLGEILDQFCDLCFESFLIAIATLQGFFPPYFLFVYLLREFWVTGLRRFMAEARMNIPSSLAGKVKTNLIMWGFLPTYLSISALLPSADPYLGHAGRIMVGLGLAAGYYSALGYTKAFAAGYAEATGRIN